MNVLFILNFNLNIGGVQTKIIDIINYLHNKRPNLHVVLILQEKSDFNQEQNISNPQTTILYYSDSFWSKIPFVFPFYLFGLTIRFKPKAMLTFTLHDAISAIIVKTLYFIKHIKVVVSEDNSEPYGITQELTVNFPIIRNFIFRLFYYKADVICAISSHIAQSLVRLHRVPLSSIIRINNWYSPIRRYNHTKPITKIFDAVYVGRLDKIKNVSFLLETSLKIVSIYPNFKFCIVGSGIEENHLKMMVNKMRLTDNVMFSGNTNNPVYYLARSKLFIFASKNEGVPMALIEAMVNKLPIVCLNYPAVHEIIRNGYNGYICQSQRKFILQTIGLLRNKNKRIQLGNNGYNLALQKFNPSNIEGYIRELSV